MKITICILNYVDTVKVLIDNFKIDIKKLSFSSKAEFEHDLESGVYEVTFLKQSKIMGHSWRKNVLLDWISCLLGVPDWTLVEKSMDGNKCLLTLKVKVEHDINIVLKLTKDGFEIIKANTDILDVTKQTEISEIAKKRIKKAYLLPVIILSMIIEICILSFGVFLLLNNQYMLSVIPFSLAVFWILLVCDMIKNKI